MPVDTANKGYFQRPSKTIGKRNTDFLLLPEKRLICNFFKKNEIFLFFYFMLRPVGFLIDKECTILFHMYHRKISVTSGVKIIYLRYFNKSWS
ncbi:unnamed protein product [Larinioides sclopetarius]|uniref:Uncharacterized protein n=1 Tax=Larinioides sclopetarius TaxID=280406 RepID=A0AAV2ARD2_9ARAC